MLAAQYLLNHTGTAGLFDGRRSLRPQLCGYDYSYVHEKALEAGGASGCPPLVVDVGANVGLSVLPVASRGLRVLAFEPVPRNLQMLQLNTFLNGWGWRGKDGSQQRVGVVHAAASSSRGTMSIHSPVGREDNSALTVPGGASSFLIDTSSGVIEHKIPSVTLDSYFEGAAPDLAKSLRLVKIDTQGHELDVLKGMHTLLKRPDLNFRVILELDVGLQKIAGHRPEEIMAYMHSHGNWRPHCIVGNTLVAQPSCEQNATQCPCYDVVFERNH